MKTGAFLVGLIALLGAGCSLEGLQMTACRTTADCNSPQTCVNRRCGFYDAGSNDLAAAKVSPDTAGDHRDAASDRPEASSSPVISSNPSRDASADRSDGAGDHPDSSNDRADASSRPDGGGDGGAVEPPIQGTCDTATVTECPAPVASTQCQQTYCGGRLWRANASSVMGYIPYRILDPHGLFSDAYKTAIRAGATAWTNATNGLITFAECAICTGRFVSVVPGSGDGVDESQPSEQVLRLPVDPTDPGNIPLHRIAHQWGHAIGLDDMYRRPDRAQYASFDPAVWCGNGASLPATCASSEPAQQPGSPPLASGTFGPYDELSVMNGLPSDGVCGKVAPDTGSEQPTLADGSAVEELYFASSGPWSRFQPIARTTGQGAPDYQLAPNVDPVGSPSIAEWATPSVDIVVRGTDGNVYETWNDVSGTSFIDWADWRVVADHVDDDPAVVFAGPTTLNLAVHSSVDGSIRLRTRTAGVWGPWGQLGAPSVGAASGPAIAALDENSLTVLVRGGDNLIYAFDCWDPVVLCAASLASANTWVPLPAPDSAGFRGKPAATWTTDSIGNEVMYVSAVRADRQGWLIGSGPGNWGSWIPIGIFASPEDPNPSVALAGLGPLDYFVRDVKGLLVHLLDTTTPFEIGGMPTFTPGVVGSLRGDHRVDVAAVIDDHGHPGVWWKFLTTQTTPPCNYNAPGTCAQCGCGYTGGLPCDL